MKKSLLALAALGAFAGAASAQSSVTVYGLVDVAAQKGINSNNKKIGDTVLGSRLGFKGTEDLGGGLAANFVIEHRFDPGTGAQQGAVMWQGRSIAGLSGAFGAIDLGRDYSVNFLMVQNTIDPFGGDTVGISRDIGMRAGGASVVRYSSQAEYHFSANGFNLGAQVADNNAANATTAGFTGVKNANGTSVALNGSEAAATAAAKEKAWSVAANYGMGPVYVAAGYQRDSDDRKTWDLGGKYNFGFATLTAGYSSSKLSGAPDRKGWLIGGIVPVGAGNIKVVYNEAKAGDTKVDKRAALGYDYNLSKRTRLFVDAARDGAAAQQKAAYDLGIAHSF